MSIFRVYNRNRELVARLPPDPAPASPFLPGFVQMSASPNVPAGWLLCDGASYLQATYPDLYSEIGTTFGTGGDGTHFQVPDYRTKWPVGAGTGDDEIYSIGQEFGQRDISLVIANIPAHTHVVFGVQVARGTAATTRSVASSTQASDVTTGSAGQSPVSPVDNRPPSLAVNFLIKY